MKCLRLAMVVVVCSLPFGPAPACSLDTCLDFCDKVEECFHAGCSCNIDRCDNEGDVADALDACMDLPCDQFQACANQAVSTCQLE